MKTNWLATPTLAMAGLMMAGGAPGLAADWQLVWSDDFDQPGPPDSAKWTYEEGFVRNNEAQFYTRARRRCTARGAEVGPIRY